MAGWHHQCNGHELGQTSGDVEGQGGLVCCSPWGCKGSDMIGQQDNNSKMQCAKKKKERKKETPNALFNLTTGYIKNEKTKA